METTNLNSNNDKQKVLDLALSDLVRDTSVVNAAIDSLTSSNLKRILKVISHAHVGQEITTGQKLELTEVEQQLIDDMFRLQQTAMGFGQLLAENDPNFNNEVVADATSTESVTEQVVETEDVITQPKGDNNE